MNTQNSPDSSINAINKIIPFQVVHQTSDDVDFLIPPLSDILLKKSKNISEGLIQSAQNRQELWRKKIHALKKRRNSLSKVRDLRRTDDTRVEKSIDRHETSVVEDKRKRIDAAAEHREEVLKKEDARQERFYETQVERKRTEKTESAEERLVRAKERKPKTEDPFERRKRVEEEKENLINNAIKKRDIKKDAINKRRVELQEIRREKFAEFEEDLEKKREKIIEIEDTAQARAEYNNSLRKPAEERRKEDTENLKNITERGRKMREEKLKRTLMHFEKLEQRMEHIFSDSVEHREKMHTVISDIISRARKKSKELMLASGHPTAEREALPEITYFTKVRAHIQQIIDEAEQNRLDWIEIKNHINERGTEKRKDHSFRSGDPRELMKQLGSIEFFLQKSEREIFDIIRNARERSEYNAMLAGIPREKRREIHKLFHRMMALLFEPTLLISEKEEQILAISRKNPSLLKRRLIERIININNSSTLFDYLESASIARRREREEAAKKDMSDDQTDNTDKNTNTTPDKELDLIMSQENLRAIFSGMLSDPIFTKESLLAQTQGNPLTSKHNASLVSDLIHIIDARFSQANFINNDLEIYTPVDPSKLIFDEIKFDTDRKLFKEKQPLENIFSRIPHEEIEKEQEEKEKIHTEERQAKKKATKKQERKEYLIKMIEEQNTTTQEKVNNERNLIDLFF